MTTITQKSSGEGVYYSAITRGFEPVSLGKTTKEALRQHRLDLLCEMAKARIAIKRIETELELKENLLE